MPEAQLSQAGQMRLRFAQGDIEIGDLAREFEVSYHTAYSAVIYNRNAESRVHVGNGRYKKASGRSLARKGQGGRSTGPSTPSSSGTSPHPASREGIAAAFEGSLKELSEEQLYALWAQPAASKPEVARRRAVTAELDQRDETGEWLEAAMAYEATIKR